MKRFAAILMLFGGGFLLASLALLFINFNPESLQGVLTSDGAFDPLAVYAFSSLKTGLLIAGITLLVLAWLFHLIVRGVIKLHQWPTGKFLLIVIGTQFILSLIYISSVEYTPGGDSVWYLRQAENITNGLGVVTPYSQPTAFWPVGYPFFLSLVYRIFGIHVFIAQLLNICFFCGISYLVYRLGLEFFDEKTARNATLLTALIPSQIFYTLLPLADIPFSFLILFLIFIATRKQTFPNTLLLGVFFGFTNMLRPTALLFPVVLIVYRFLKSGQFKRSLAQLVFIFVVGEMIMLPWQIRNYQIFHTFVLSANYGGYNLAMGNNPHASGGVMAPDVFIPRDQLSYYNSLDEAQKDRFLMKLGTNYIISHPGHSVILALKKLVHLYYKDSKAVTYSLGESYAQFAPAVIMAMILVTEGYYYALGLSFLLSIWIVLKKEGLSERTWIILATILYFTLVYLPLTAEGRYHMPLLPIFALVVCSAGLSARKAAQ